MRLFRSISGLNKGIFLPKLCLTIGNFDGLHLGHFEVIKRLKEIAKNQNLASAILTFEPHPAMFFKSENQENFRIFSLAQKIAAIAETELDYLIILPFNQNLGNLSADDFIKILTSKLNLEHLVIGHDFTFGKNRQGNFLSLQNRGFGLTQIDCFGTETNISEVQKTKIISSTAIRQAILRGEVEIVKKLCGRNFTISGRVINGRKLARQIGFPTINIKALPKIIKPRFGVYKGKVHIANQKGKIEAIINFGLKPTFQSNAATHNATLQTIEQPQIQPLYEAHLLNFNQDLYGKKVAIELEKFIRPEQKFEEIEQLKNQIKADILNAYS